MFAEWAAGVCSAPDPDTVNKHVAAMVDVSLPYSLYSQCQRSSSFCFQAVFKHYDNDRDGYISKAEFELIAGNFPFIDPFVMIDVDRSVPKPKPKPKPYDVSAAIFVHLFLSIYLLP